MKRRARRLRDPPQPALLCLPAPRELAEIDADLKVVTANIQRMSFPKYERYRDSGVE